MEIIQKFISKNRSYKKFSPIGIVVHETANPGDNNEIEFSYFNNNDVSASAHLFVDTNSVMQMIPFDEVGWHCGKKGNHQYLGCELCHATTPENFRKIWNNAVRTFAHVFIHVLKIDKVTIENLPSHAEISVKYKETDHMDPVAYFAQNGKTVNAFRSDVQAQIDNMLFEITVSNSMILNSPNYWRLNCHKGLKVKGLWMQKVITNFVSIDKTCSSFNEAVDILSSMNLIFSPDFWKLNCVEGLYVDGSYARILLIRMGRYLLKKTTYSP
jgi:hypothetical protein